MFRFRKDPQGTPVHVGHVGPIWGTEGLEEALGEGWGRAASCQRRIPLP